jgi:uncharacterized membrane protein YczE
MAHIGNLPRLTRRLVQLYLGLIAYGVSMALMIRSRLGNMPWDVLHQGLAQHLGVPIGWVAIGVGAVALLAWIPLRQMPGIGTVSNVIVIGLVMDWVLDWLPVPDALWLRIVELVSGIVLNGLATGAYIGAGLGPGPRDGLMTGLAHRTGRSIRLVRTGLEVVVVAAGWLLGGVFGVGTLLYAITIGPLAQLFLPLFTVGRRDQSVSQPVTERPAGLTATTNVASTATVPASSVRVNARWPRRYPRTSKPADTSTDTAANSGPIMAVDARAEAQGQPSTTSASAV